MTLNGTPFLKPGPQEGSWLRELIDAPVFVVRIELFDTVVPVMTETGHTR
jgi:hypothetical protein